MGSDGRNYEVIANEEIDDKIKAKRQEILKAVLDEEKKTGRKGVLDDKFKSYQNIVKNMLTAENGWMGILFYFGYQENWKENEEAIKLAACIDIFQLNSVLNFYMIYCPNLHCVQKIREVVNKFLPDCHKITEKEDDNAMRAILACICDYLIIIVNQYLDDVHIDHETRHIISEWYNDTQIKLYQMCVDNSDDKMNIWAESKGISTLYLGRKCGHLPESVIYDETDNVIIKAEYAFLLKTVGEAEKIERWSGHFAETEIMHLLEKIGNNII